MKKLSITFFLILSLLMAACFPASADVITAMAIEVNPEHLEKTASYARILGYNPYSNTLTVELIAPEVFNRDDVVFLQEGDGIYTGGQVVDIQTITEYPWGCVINEGNYEYAEGSVYLYRDYNANYRPMNIFDDYTWLSLDIIECPIPDSMLFLDYSRGYGWQNTLPIVRTAGELKDALLKETVHDVFLVGVSRNNVYVVFDEEGKLFSIQRFYIPYQ